MVSPSLKLSKASGDSYPPYNIEQTGPDGLRITLAVAGFAPSDLSVTVENNQLVIRGKQNETGQRVFLHRGIAARQFQRAFLGAQHFAVRGDLAPLDRAQRLQLGKLRPALRERKAKLPIVEHDQRRARRHRLAFKVQNACDVALDRRGQRRRAGRFQEALQAEHRPVLADAHRLHRHRPGSRFRRARLRLGTRRHQEHDDGRGRAEDAQGEQKPERRTRSRHGPSSPFAEDHAKSGIYGRRPGPATGAGEGCCLRGSGLRAQAERG